jgi:hypothetical protein
MRYLWDRWQTHHLQVVDNILDMRYFSDLLPALAEDERPWEIFYEVKANLSRAQVASLRAAGVTRIQPGIESFSDRLLKLMRKGTSGLRNVQLLKWCREHDVGVDWNIIYGFPGRHARTTRRCSPCFLPSNFSIRPGPSCAFGSIALAHISTGRRNLE